MFHLIEEEITRSTGQARRPDITIKQVNGVKWVRVRERPRGISTFDMPLKRFKDLLNALAASLRSEAV